MLDDISRRRKLLYVAFGALFSPMLIGFAEAIIFNTSAGPAVWFEFGVRRWVEQIRSRFVQVDVLLTVGSVAALLAASLVFSAAKTLLREAAVVAFILAIVTVLFTDLTLSAALGSVWNLIAS